MSTSLATLRSAQTFSLEALKAHEKSGSLRASFEQTLCKAFEEGESHKDRNIALEKQTRDLEADAVTIDDVLKGACRDRNSHRTSKTPKLKRIGGKLSRCKRELSQDRQSSIKPPEGLKNHIDTGNMIDEKSNRGLSVDYKERVKQSTDNTDRCKSDDTRIFETRELETHIRVSELIKSYYRLATRITELQNEKTSMETVHCKLGEKYDKRARSFDETISKLIKRKADTRDAIINMTKQIRLAEQGLDKATAAATKSFKAVEFNKKATEITERFDRLNMRAPEITSIEAKVSHDVQKITSIQAQLVELKKQKGNKWLNYF